MELQTVQKQNNAENTTLNIINNIVSSFKNSNLLSQEKIDVSIIIVNWNSKNYLKKTIESLYHWTKEVDFELIVIDNDSNQNDESYKFIETELLNYNNVRVLFNSENSGFAKANNIGIDISLGKYVLLLNPDVILQSNVIKTLRDYLNDNSDVGMIGPKVLNIDGTFQTSCRRGEPDPLSVFFALSNLKGIYQNHPKYYAFSLDNLDPSKIQSVAGLSGCCMMVKKELIEQIGKMDEQFFLYQEETDWCYRAYKSGWRIIYQPEAVIIHDRGGTTKQKILKTNFVFCSSMMKFFRKHFFNRYGLLKKCFFLILIWGNFFVRYFRILAYYKYVK